MKKLTKRVQADGLWFDVPADTASVMVNAFGQVLAISIGVVLSKGEHNWVIKHGIDDFVCPVGVVDLGGADWRECCWYVGDQFDGEYVSMAVQIRDEISDFCAGLESPGCPETAEEIQSQLMNRILPLIKDERREWMARGTELLSSKVKSLGLHAMDVWFAEDFAAKIRAGEVE